MAWISLGTQGGRPVFQSAVMLSGMVGDVIESVLPGEGWDCKGDGVGKRPAWSVPGKAGLANVFASKRIDGALVALAAQTRGVVLDQQRVEDVEVEDLGLLVATAVPQDGVEGGRPTEGAIALQAA
jgi:hypothetical protein